MTKPQHNLTTDQEEEEEERTHGFHSDIERSDGIDEEMERNNPLIALFCLEEVPISVSFTLPISKSRSMD